jgi:MFS family permease
LFPIDAALAALLALALGAPIVPLAIAWVHRRRPLVAPAAVMIAMAIAATSFAVATGFFGDPAALAVIAPVLAAMVIIRVPVMRERLAIVLPLLAIGWFGGLLGVAIEDPGNAARLGDVIAGRGFDAERMAEIGLGNATIGREGVLVDTFNAPAVVLGRGRAHGLLSPSDEDFALSLIFSRLDAPFVAVPDPAVGNGSQDRLNKGFPLLYRHGAPGYRLLYENASWRLFARSATPYDRRS